MLFISTARRAPRGFGIVEFVISGTYPPVHGGLIQGYVSFQRIRPLFFGAFWMARSMKAPTPPIKGLGRRCVVPRRRLHHSVEFGWLPPTNRTAADTNNLSGASSPEQHIDHRQYALLFSGHLLAQSGGQHREFPFSCPLHNVRFAPH